MVSLGQLTKLKTERSSDVLICLACNAFLSVRIVGSTRAKGWLEGAFYGIDIDIDIFYLTWTRLIPCL